MGIFKCLQPYVQRCFNEYSLVLLSLSLGLVCSLASYAEPIENFRWSIDGSARINNNIASDNTSRIFALGLDTHKVFTSKSGDIGYMVGQLYFTKLSNQTPFPWMFDDKDDSTLVIREAHVNYTAGPAGMPNIRLGHFTLPFGLENNLDTNGRLLDYNHGKNLGAKVDWGIGLNDVLETFQYSVSYTLGGKDEPKSINGSYAVTGRVGSLSYHDFVFGASLYHAEIDGIKRKRIAIDWQYYWHTWGLLGEAALGKDTKQQQWRNEQYYLLEVNKSSVDEQLKLYTQYIVTNRSGEKKNNQLVNVGLSYQFNGQLELSMSSRKQLITPESGKKQHLVRAQLRYRF